MAYLSVNCPQCGLKSNLQDSSIGTMRRCEGCGNKFVVAAPALRPVSSSSGCVAALILLTCGGVVALGCCGVMGFGLLGSVTPAKPAVHSATSSPGTQFTKGEGITVGQVTATLTTAKIGPVQLGNFADNNYSEQNYLIVTISLKNASPTKRIEFRGWPDNDHFPNVLLKDEHGNQYKNIRFPQSTVTGDDGRKTLSPDDTATAVMVFEKPIRAAKQLFLEAGGDSIGDSSVRLHWTLYRKDWEGWGDDGGIAKEAEAAANAPSFSPSQAKSESSKSFDPSSVIIPQGEIASRTRTVESKDGKFSAEVVFVALHNETAYLKKISTQEIIEVPMNKLANKDRIWIRRMAAEDKKKDNQ